MNKILSNQNGGIALTMVITSVVLISTVTINFVYDNNVNKLKVYNTEDREKSKLTAEAGLKFAMARLRLYQEGFNFLQNNKAAKDVVTPQILDSIWNFPFIYPIPVTKKMNAIQKNAIAKFAEETILEGSLRLTINNISNKINLNLIRVSLLNEAAKANVNEGNPPPETNEEDLEFNVETQIFRALTNAIETKSLTDEIFNSQYFGMEIAPLVNELKFAVSEPNSLEDNAGADIRFQDIPLEPKRAPFSSFSEVKTLPSWPDDITELIQNEFTVHGALMIDLNKITDKLFRLLIPDATFEDIQEFFKFKDNPENPQHFNSLEEFKNYVVNVGNIMSESAFTERFTKFKSQGLEFGPTPTLFKVISSSTVGRSTFNLTAYVVIPAQPKPRTVAAVAPSATKDTDGDGKKDNVDDDIDGDGILNDEDEDPYRKGNEGGSATEQKTLLLTPRIVEIIIG